ncbi:unnamed protein product [Schistosoma margrebowiei]|uniref:Uncharacterized protein n=1 Tax=Schistosoma margrebowiei TaxID=48269 RepID=A0A183LIP2_9TREM|nr:unnamed protein product [Schistosoma margrebowiei]
MSSTTKKIEQMQQHAIELSLEAMNLFSSHDDIADYIAKTFKETYSGCWECKVGTTFGRPMPLLTTRATIYLGTWNVRTMWDTGRTLQIAAEMRRYNLEVLGISEIHWTQVGQQRLTSGELLLYSGHEEENAPHTQGVALMLSNQAKKGIYSMGISWTKDHQSLVQNKERGYFN